MADYDTIITRQNEASNTGGGTSSESSGVLRLDELLTGAIDGVNKVFTTEHDFIDIVVRRNGVTMHVGDDFGITGTNQITFVTAPVATANAKVTGSYISDSQNVIGNIDEAITRQIKMEMTPVGTIYENATDATSPATTLGFGVWTQMPTDFERQLISTKVLHWSTGDVVASTTKQNRLGTYGSDMLTLMLMQKSGMMTIPSGYHVEYKMQAELSTSAGHWVKLYLNNIETSVVTTWSGDTFRHTAATDYFRQEEVVLEPTVNYSTNGINFGWVSNSNSGNIRVYLPTLSAYLVKDTPVYKWRRTA